MEALCGCYYYLPFEGPFQGRSIKKFLPQVDVSAHTKILSTTSRTLLSQAFVNPSSTHEVPECKYVFPLYDSVSVIGFTCKVGSRTITGVVKEKFKAKEDYNEAVGRGETAALLEQGPTSDVFVTSLGNIPAGEKLLVHITYIGELKHDVGISGLRFTLPTKISPRYGSYGVDTTEQDSTVATGGFAITVDVSMDGDSPLQEIRSPSHPIAVTLGRVSTAATDSHNPAQASATLSLETSALEKDFVLEVRHHDSGKPKAVLETHPTIKGQRALMATLVPETPTKLSKPEVIFVADQSGSMRGERTQTLAAALKIFMKSLPIGIRFNICLFGSSHSFLFNKSQAYGQDSLAKAMKAVEGLDASYGGTETLKAVQASIESRHSEEDLSLILATDGDIWQQQEFFDYLNTAVSQSKKSLRVFALGIGNSVSSALIEGVARAGNGFSQSVANGEKLDSKVVRMLKGALTPTSGSYTMEVLYRKQTEIDEEDDFVLVERVTDSLQVMLLDENNSIDLQMHGVATDTAGRTPGADMSTENGQARYAHLPIIAMPKLLQTPQNIPPLYPSSRSTIYILMSPEASQSTPTSVILRNNSHEEPFEIEMSVEILAQPSETIHQLAAKKAVTELEEGRGWLLHAKDKEGILLKEKYGDQFNSFVEREAVRLGVEYQIAGKHTSFVAIESTNKVSTKSPEIEIGITKTSTEETLPARRFIKNSFSSSAGALNSFGGFSSPQRLSAPNPPPPAPVNLNSNNSTDAMMSRSTGLFGAPSAPQTQGLFMKARTGGRGGGRGTRHHGISAPSSAVQTRNAFGPYSSDTTSSGPRNLFEAVGSRQAAQPLSSQPQPQHNRTNQPARKSTGGKPPRKQMMSMAATPSIDPSPNVPQAKKKKIVKIEESDSEDACLTDYSDEELQNEKVETDPLQKIVALQTFEGFWEPDESLLNVIGVSSSQNEVPEGLSSRSWATILAVTFLEKKMSAEKDAWEMVVDKAKEWLSNECAVEKAEAGWALAGELVGGQKA